MKLKTDMCETCKNIGGYIYRICHDDSTHESICGDCLASRIEKHSPENKKLIAHYRSKK